MKYPRGSSRLSSIYLERSGKFPKSHFTKTMSTESKLMAKMKAMYDDELLHELNNRSQHQKSVS